MGTGRDDGAWVVGEAKCSAAQCLLCDFVLLGSSARLSPTSQSAVFLRRHKTHYSCAITRVPRGTQDAAQGIALCRRDFLLLGSSARLSLTCQCAACLRCHRSQHSWDSRASVSKQVRLRSGEGVCLACLQCASVHAAPYLPAYSVTLIVCGAHFAAS